MSIPLTINGATFEYPVNFDENWGVQATGWAQAVTNGMLQRSGGNFPLIADVNFGPTFGLLADHFETRVTNPATSGLIRLSKTDTIDWRNNANSADNVLSVNASDQLLYNGTIIGVATGVTSITGTANEIIASASTGNITLSTPQAIAPTSPVIFGQITDSGLTASELVVTDGSKQLVSQASPTLTELGFVGGVTSAIQTQINTLTSTKLSLTGGTMSGAIAMGGNKITGMADGTAPTDAVTLEQISRLLIPASQLTAVSAFSTASTTYQITPLSITYTPISTSSRIKISVTCMLETENSANSPVFMTIMRNSTDLGGPGGTGFVSMGIASLSTDDISPATVIFIDSPATMSPIVYAVFIKTGNVATTVHFNPGLQRAVMIIEEVA